MKPIYHTLLWLTLFSIAMGFLETAVVVYLRELYYPKGFSFPLAPVPPRVALTEFFREAATILMLYAIGALAGKNRAQRFGFFIFCFAIWDICYYVFLYVLLRWPESFFTWDILFLIPIPWVGPVLAPCQVSLTMIVYCLLVVRAQGKGRSGSANAKERLLMLAGASLILFSFMLDYLLHLHHFLSLSDAWLPGSSHDLFEDMKNFIPQHFNWTLFLSGELIWCAGIFLFVKRQQVFVPAKPIIGLWKDSVNG